MTTGHSSKETVNISTICALLREMDTTGAEVNLHNIAAMLERLDRENAELKALVTNRESTIEFLQESAAERERDIERAAHEPLWRPIAQAPRDGTWVLVAHKCYGLPVVARWHDGDWLSSSNERGLLVDKWSTLPDVQDTRVSSETREQPRRHFSRNKFDRHLCDTCGADYELHEKDEMGNWCPSNTKEPHIIAGESSPVFQRKCHRCGALHMSGLPIGVGVSFCSRACAD